MGSKPNKLFLPFVYSPMDVACLAQASMISQQGTKKESPGQENIPGNNLNTWSLDNENAATTGH